MKCLLTFERRLTIALLLFKRATPASIALAALLMSLGIVAVVVPSVARLRPAILFDWLPVLSGLIACHLIWVKTWQNEQ